MSDSQMPPAQDAKEAIGRARVLWGCLLFLPMLYLGVCVLLGNWLFDDPEGRRGFLTLSSGGLIALIVIMAILVIIAWGFLLFFRRRSDLQLERVDGNVEVFGHLLWRRLLFLGGVCDSVSGLGLIAYLFVGDLRAMLILGAISYFLYIGAYPGENLARKAGL